MEPINCKNCGSIVNSNYCGNCGQNRSQRISFKLLASDIYDGLFDFESPFLKILISLTLNPGKVYREYLAGARKRYFSPIRYALWILALTIAVAGFYDTPIVPNLDMLSIDREAQEALTPIFTFINAAIIPITLATALFNAIIAKLIFYQEKYSVAELYTPFLLNSVHLNLLSIPAIIFGIYGTKEHLVFTVIISVLYMVWAIAELYQPRRFANYLKSALVTFAAQFVGFGVGTVIGLSFSQ